MSIYHGHVESLISPSSQIVQFWSNKWTLLSFNYGEIRYVICYASIYGKSQGINYFNGQTDTETESHFR